MMSQTNLSKAVLRSRPRKVTSFCLSTPTVSSTTLKVTKGLRNNVTMKNLGIRCHRLQQTVKSLSPNNGSAAIQSTSNPSQLSYSRKDRFFSSLSNSGSGGSSLRCEILKHDLKMSMKKKTSRYAPFEAAKILQELLQWHSNEVTVQDCNQVVRSLNNASRNKHDKNGPETALGILNKMVEVYKQNGNESVRPTVVTYNNVSKAHGHKGDVKSSTMVFDMQIDDYETNENNDAKPNSDSFGHVMYACSKSKLKIAPLLACDLLEDMIEWHVQGKLNEKPIARHYITVMNACARNGDVERAISVQQKMKNNLHDIPYVRTYSVLINAWAKSGKDDAPIQAKKILMELSRMYRNGLIEDGPNTITYSSVIDAYASQGNAEGANDILLMMEDDFEAGNNDVIPNIRTYTSIINAWSKSDDINAPRKVTDILKKLITMYANGETEERPNTFTYTSVINVFASRGDSGGANKILEMMQDDYKSGNNDAKPNMLTYSALISAWSKSKDNDATRKAVNILKEVNEKYLNKELDKRPDIITYGTVMKAYVSHGDPQGASDVLTMMKDDFEAGNNTVKPDSMAYRVVINAWTRSTDDDAISQAKHYLDEMIEMHLKGFLNEGPNTIVYGGLLDMYANKGDIRSAMNLFQRMKTGDKNGKPDVIAYTILIKAWAKSNNERAQEAVETILREINNLHSSGTLEEGPNRFTYSFVIECLQKFKGTENRVTELRTLRAKTKGGSYH